MESRLTRASDLRGRAFGKERYAAFSLHDLSSYVSLSTTEVAALHHGRAQSCCVVMMVI